jgi:hypothetical protein
MQKPTVTIRNKKEDMTITVTHVRSNHYVICVDGVDVITSASSLGEAHSKAQSISRMGRAAWLERLAFAA